MHQYTQVQFIKRNDYYDVIIYYSKNGEKFRKSTGVKVDIKYLLPSGSISTKHPNYEEDLKKIKEVRDKIEILAATYKNKYGDKPPIEWLEKEFNKPLEQVKKKTENVLDYWEEFIEEKKASTRAEGTIRLYNNLRQTIDSFCKKKNFNLTFDNLTLSFFNEFINYLVHEHEYVRNPHMKPKDGELLPEVGISNETAIKRLKNFKEYLKFCVVEHDINLKLEKIAKYIDQSKHKYEIRSLSRTQKWELTITVAEINFVVNLDYYEPEYWESLSENQKRYLDILIFMCLQGMSPIDVKEFNRTDIRHGKIIKERSKSGNEFAVELHPISEKILERNAYNLNFTDQTVNDELKRLFVTIFELYKKHYEEKYKKPYEVICIQKIKKGDRIINKIQHKGLFVELMTGRRSFITNLCEKAEELGIKETMDKVGHVKINTTMGYIHLSSRNKHSGDLFGISKK